MQASKQLVDFALRDAIQNKTSLRSPKLCFVYRVNNHQLLGFKPDFEHFIEQKPEFTSLCLFDDLVSSAE
jgi:hypothetical protein